ncbi:hypothetical protein CKAH01_12299 [Colletotrichum kahawae]|uniref:Uncharacterized protein n=1 Tax=Colletotrichum kahawae TaxID=34407 RepID=A0AAD9YTP8_COLKA|nr:hypothetical protein CKAH01_12299 [Colletotrichum kahawae]
MPSRKECDGLIDRMDVLPILLERVKRLLNRLQHSSITNSLASESLVEDAIFHSLSRVGAEVRFLDETIERYLSCSDPDTGNILDGPKRLLAFAPASRNEFLVDFTTEQTLGFSRELSTAFVIDVGPDAKYGSATERRPDHKPLSESIMRLIDKAVEHVHVGWLSCRDQAQFRQRLGQFCPGRLLAQWERPSDHPTKDRGTQVLVTHQGMDNRVSVDEPKQRQAVVKVSRHDISDVEQSSEPETSGRTPSQLSEALHERNDDVGFDCQAHAAPGGAFHQSQKASHQRQFSLRQTPNSKPSSTGGRERETPRRQLTKTFGGVAMEQAWTY